MSAKEPTDEKPTIWHKVLSVPLNELSAEDFERMCFQLVDSDASFNQVAYHGAKGSDYGRDIVAVKTLSSGDKQTWVFQCKRRRKYEVRLFLDDVRRLSLSKTRADVVVFVTADDISSAMIDDVQSLSGDLGYQHVEFWGKTKLIGLLEANRIVLNQYFRAEVYLIEEIQKQIGKYIKELHQESEGQNDAIAKLELLVKIILALEVYQIVSKLVAEFRPATRKLERDEKKLNEIKRKTEEKFAEHKEQLGAISREFTVVGQASVKGELLELARAEQLEIPRFVHDVVKGERLFTDEALGLVLALSHAREDKKMYELLWTALMDVFYLHIAEELIPHEIGYGSFLSGCWEKCPSCKRRLKFDVFRGPLAVSKDGAYLTTGFDFLYCNSCKFVTLRRLRVDRNIRL